VGDAAGAPLIRLARQAFDQRLRERAVVPVGPLEFDPLCRSIASTGTLHKRQHSVPTMALLPNESPEQLARGQQATIQPMQS